MPDERLDYSHELRRHERFVGRAALLARLDRLLVADAADRWVVVTGGPGMGKSALLAAWLLRREGAGAAVPHHFIRRGEYDWDDPAKLVGSLVAQLEARFPEAREAEAEARRHPAARLAAALRRVSERTLVPRGERLVVLIDGLDEYDPPAGAVAGDPLAAFLPHALPAGVRLLCASRPRHPYVSSLEARDGEPVQIDLDDRDCAADNNATVRALWDRAAPSLGLEPRFVDEAVARAGGNAQHAVTLQRHLKSQGAARRRVEDIPRGLAALLEKTWERIATNPVVVHGLGILCAAREALTLDELGVVASWTGDAERRAFLRDARELLVEARRPDGQAEYRLHHDSIRAHIAGAIGAAALRGHHAALAQRLATWPALAEAAARRYALRHALIHRAEAADWAGAWRLAADMSFLEAKYRELGAREVEADVARVSERCRASGDVELARRFGDLARALVRESHRLGAAPEATAALVWNRLRRLGWSAADLDAEIRLPPEASFLRVRHVAMRESPALVRELIGHVDGVNACAVSADGRRVVSASDDRTLRVWDFESGATLATLDGHAHKVSACAVTADGRRVISGSLGGDLKVWDLERRRAIATLKGHTDLVHACAVTGDDRRVISASADRSLKVWDLESGDMLATLEGHADWVRCCVVTADGRVVSGSYDGTLKVWDLESGRVLRNLEGHADWVRCCAVTTDGRFAVSGSADRTLRVWDLETGDTLAVLKGHASWVVACAVTADGRRVVSASADGTLKVWDIESRCALATLEGHADWVRACAVTADGRRVISGSADRTLKVWDLEQALAVGNDRAGRVSACWVAADGRRAVSASEDGTLTVWDLESGRTLATLKGHVGGVNVRAVTEDGRYAVSASEDGTLKVWDPGTHACLFTHRGDAAYTAVAATAAVIVAGDATGGVWTLDWPTEHRGARPHGVGDSQERQRASVSAHELSPPRPPMKKHTILFLAANPSGTDPLALDREARAIHAELERAGRRDSFQLETRWAVEPLDLLRELRTLRPTVVHFSGHGGPDRAGEHRLRPGSRQGAASVLGTGTGSDDGRMDRARRRDVDDGLDLDGGAAQHGLFFHRPDGGPQVVSTAALEATFGAVGASVRLVVLSACYSEVHAEALLAHVDCVVGMGGAILDDAARSFAIGFYGGLGAGESVAAAFRQGCAAIHLEGLPDADRPRLRVRAGVDAGRLVLVDREWR